MLNHPRRGGGWLTNAEALSVGSFTEPSQSGAPPSDTVPALTEQGGIRHRAEESLRRVGRKEGQFHVLIASKLPPSRSTMTLFESLSYLTFCCHFNLSTHLAQVSKVNHLVKNV